METLYPTKSPSVILVLPVHLSSFLYVFLFANLPISPYSPLLTSTTKGFSRPFHNTRYSLLCNQPPSSLSASPPELVLFHSALVIGWNRDHPQFLSEILEYFSRKRFCDLWHISYYLFGTSFYQVVKFHMTHYFMPQSTFIFLPHETFFSINFIKNVDIVWGPNCFCN